jgi:hypothetical protein
MEQRTSREGDMPKHIIVFNLPKEQKDLEYAIEGNRWAGLVYEFSEYLRQQYKYVEKKDQADIEKIRDTFFNLLNEYDLEIY